jgi:hypothetical protein
MLSVSPECWFLGQLNSLAESNRRGADPYARRCGRGGVARHPLSQSPVKAERDLSGLWDDLCAEERRGDGAQKPAELPATQPDRHS